VNPGAPSFEFLHGIVNAIADPVLVKDRQHRFIFVNDPMCRFLGRSREELLRKSAVTYSKRFLRRNRSAKAPDWG